MAVCRIEVNDPRGEYWRYTEGALTASIGRGRDGGSGWIVNTSDTFFAGETPSLETVAVVLGRFLAFGADGKPLTLMVDGQFDLREEHLAAIDKILKPRRYKRNKSAPPRIVWSRTRR